MAGTGIMAEICISTYSSPYPIEKVENSPHPINMEISRQNGNEFGQYPHSQIYLTSLIEVGHATRIDYKDSKSTLHCTQISHFPFVLYGPLDHRRRASHWSIEQGWEGLHTK